MFLLFFIWRISIKVRSLFFSVKVVTEKVGTSETEDAALDDSISFYESVSRIVSRGIARRSRVNSATQTVGQRLNAGTQTPSEQEDV